MVQLNRYYQLETNALYSDASGFMQGKCRHLISRVRNFYNALFWTDTASGSIQWNDSGRMSYKRKVSQQLKTV